MKHTILDLFVLLALFALESSLFLSLTSIYPSIYLVLCTTIFRDFKQCEQVTITPIVYDFHFCM